MCYMDRLGLWGVGQSFRRADDFLAAIMRGEYCQLSRPPVRNCASSAPRAPQAASARWRS
jgi:hypothetical protein